MKTVVVLVGGFVLGVLATASRRLAVHPSCDGNDRRFIE